MYKNIRRIDIRDIIIIFLFFISIIVDNINGYLIKQVGIHTPIGQIFRVVVIIMVLNCLLRKYKNIGLVIGSTFVMFLLSILWSLLYDAEFVEELSIMIKISYIPLMILYFTHSITFYDKQKLLKIIATYGFIIAILIIVCFIFGIGNLSYGTNYGFGNKAYFKAGNDLGLTIVLSLIVSCFLHIKTNSGIISLFRCFTIATGGFLVGSRVGMILSTLVLITFFAVTILNSNKNRVSVFVCSICFMIFAFYLGSRIYAQLDEWTIARFEMESMQEARFDLKKEAIDYIESFQGLELFIGKGWSNLTKHVARGLSLDLETKGVEADWHEMIGCYGYVGGGSVILFYLFLFYKSLRRYLKFRDIENLFYLSITFLVVVISFLAGHVFSNVMIAPIFGIVVAFILQPRSNLNTRCVPSREKK